MVKKIAFSLLIFIVLSSCGGESPSVTSSTHDPCPVEQIQQFLEVTEGLEHSFNQLVKQADITPGEDLEPVIKEMQVIEVDVEEVDPPPCALTAKSALSSYMGTTIQGYFKLFVQGIELPTQSDRTADDEFTLAASKLAYYETTMDALRNIIIERGKSE